MTDTTPLKGIPSRVPTGGFRSPPTTQGPNRPSMSRMPAGRKEGGVKLLEIGEQPLGYAAAKKRKREQEREEQQKKAAEQAIAQASQDVKPVITTPTTSTVTTTTPDYAAGLTASTVYSQPATPMPVTTAKETVVPTVAPQPIMQSQPPQPVEIKQEVKQEIKTEPVLTSSIPIQTVPIVSSTPIHQHTAPPVPPLAYTTPQAQKLISIKTEPTTSIPIAISSNPPSLVRTVPIPSTTQIKAQPQHHIQQLPTIASSVQMIQNATTTLASKPTLSSPKIEIISSKTIQPGTIQTSIPKSTTIINQGGNILFTTKQVQPNTTSSASGTTIIQQKQGQYVLNTSPPGKQINIQRLITNANVTGTPTLTTTISRAQHQQQLLQAQQQSQQQQQTQQPTTPTRIVQIKTAPTVSLNNNQLMQNIPPLISTQHPGSGTQPTILNIQTIQQQQQQHQQQVQIQHQPTTPQKRTITITAQSPQNNNMIATSVAQILQQQQLQQQQTIQTTSIVTGSTQQPKYAQVVMSPNVKGKTIFLTNPSNIPSVLNQKGVILRTVDPSGNTVYQQIPLQNVSGLSGATIISGGPPGLVKAEPDSKPQLSQIPALVPTSSLHQNIPALTPVVLQQPQQQQTQQTSTIPALITNISQQQAQQQTQQIKTSPQTMTIIRPVGGNNVQTVLPQGLTLIQRPGQQPQLVQTIQAGGQTQVQQQPQTRTIITQIPQQQIQQQQQQQTQPQHTIQFQAAGTPRAGGTTIQLVQQPHQERTIVQQQPQQIQIQRTQIAQQQQQHGTTVTIQQNATAVGQQQVQQQGTRKGLSLSNKHVMEAHDMFKRANRVTRLEKALILGFMAGYRDNPRPNPENVVTIKLNESQEKVLQADDTQALMLVESLITLDYNTGEWKTFRKYRELDPSQQHESGPAGQGQGQATNQQNSVVI